MSAHVQVFGGPNRRWFSFDPKYERFTAYSLPATRSGNATGNTMRVHPDNTVWLAAIASNQEWRESRPAQFAVAETKLVEAVGELLARHGVKWG